MTFRVKVSKQGNHIRDLYWDAETPLEAINAVESNLGLNPPSASIDHSTGKMVVNNWHGYEFSAKQVS